MKGADEAMAEKEYVVELTVGPELAAKIAAIADVTHEAAECVICRAIQMGVDSVIGAQHSDKK